MTLETWDLWDICSKWWEDMTWPKNYKEKYKHKDKDKVKDILSNLRDLWHLRHWLQFWQLRNWIHDNLWDLTINCDTGQHLQFLQCFKNIVSNYRAKTKTKTMTKTKTKTFWEHFLRAILDICDIWDTDYNSDNWEPEFMTNFVIWQLIVTLDSIRNSCDVCIQVLID